MGEPDYSGVFDAAEERSDIGNVGAWDDAPTSEETNAEKPDAGKDEARVEEALTEEDNLFQGLGFINPYTGGEIRNREDFLAWKQQYAAEQKDAPAGESQHPGGNADDVGIREHIDGELEKIRRWDPSVQGLEQIAASERFEEIYEKVKRGYSLADAFYLAHGERLQKQAADRAEQALRNRLQSKEHLEKTGSRGGSETVVPKEVMKEFRRIFPKAGSEEIRKFYRRDQAHLKH